MAILDEIRRFWDDDAATYDDAPGHRPRSPAVQAAWTAALEALLPPAPARVLDCGAGTGFLSLIAARLGHRVTALDLSPGMLASAFGAAAGAEDLDIAVVVAPAHEPPREPHGFDAVIERHLLWTLPDPVAALRAWRAAAPSGRLVAVESLWGEADPLEALRGTGPDDWCDAGAAPRPITTAPYPAEVRGRAASRHGHPSPRRGRAGGRGGMGGPAPRAPARRRMGVGARAAPPRAPPRGDPPLRRRGHLNRPAASRRPAGDSGVGHVCDRRAQVGLEGGVAHGAVHGVDDRARAVDEHRAGIADEGELRGHRAVGVGSHRERHAAAGGRRPGRWRDRRCRRRRRRPRCPRRPAPGGPRRATMGSSA